MIASTRAATARREMAMDLQAFERGLCPYCGGPLEFALDPSAGDQVYVEDCQVCCRPILVAVAFDAQGEARLRLRRDDG